MKKVLFGLCATLLLVSSAIQPAWFNFNTAALKTMGSSLVNTIKKNPRAVAITAAIAGLGVIAYKTYKAKQAEHKFITDFYTEAQTHGKATRDIGHGKIIITHTEQTDTEKPTVTVTFSTSNN